MNTIKILEEKTMNLTLKYSLPIDLRHYRVIPAVINVCCPINDATRSRYREIQYFQSRHGVYYHKTCNLSRGRIFLVEMLSILGLKNTSVYIRESHSHDGIDGFDVIVESRAESIITT